MLPFENFKLIIQLYLFIVVKMLYTDALHDILYIPKRVDIR